MPTVLGTADDLALKAQQMAAPANPSGLSGLLTPAQLAARDATLASHLTVGANFIVYAAPTPNGIDAHHRAGIRWPVSGTQVAIGTTSLGQIVAGALQISAATMAILQADPVLRIVLADPIA